MRAVLFASSPNSDIPAELAFVNNYGATVDPVATNDSSQGYQRGSTWVNKSTKVAWTCVDDTVGAAVWNEGTSASGQLVAPPAATATAPGGTALVKGGSGGTTSGAGGPTDVFGGDATAGNSNGGDVNIVGGAKQGSGVNGVVRVLGATQVSQGAPTATTVSATLTAAALLSGIITVNQGAAGASAQQLPLATAMDTALPSSAAGEAFDFSVINISTVDAEDASLTTNAGWTLVGAMEVPAYSAVGSLNSSGRFRARKTGAGAWTLYRLS